MCSRRGSKRWRGGGSARRIQFAHNYEDIISIENLLAAWKEFVRGKRKKKDVQEFQHSLMDNILKLHRELNAGTYKHGGYQAFKISDPKPRDIHKASVRDRLVHHAIYRILYPFFDRTFIADSYSCRKGKGTHRAMNRFRQFAYKISRNHTRTCWVLKCDIRKFFASIDQTILIDFVRRYIPDKRIVALIAEVVGSFSCGSLTSSKGLPLGNLTSQLLVNIYMNEFDQYVKHKFKVKYYIRYADDFVVLSRDREWLRSILRYIAMFLRERLKLELHPDKVSIQTIASGVDFLGWVHFPDHRVLRTATKRRMLRNLADNPKHASVESYLGLLSHGNTSRLRTKLLRGIVCGYERQD
jgi:retron-type reverse transcriptase